MTLPIRFPIWLFISVLYDVAPNTLVVNAEEESSNPIRLKTLFCVAVSTMRFSPGPMTIDVNLATALAALVTSLAMYSVPAKAVKAVVTLLTVAVGRVPVFNLGTSLNVSDHAKAADPVPKITLRLVPT